ncbi:MAG: 5'/3'-nucleotidase SurE [Bauldia sp.]
MRILLTNDDGVHSPGLAALERVAASLSSDIWVVAPESDQSGLAHSLTLNDPLRLRQLGPRKFAVSGTPTDCVIMAVRQIAADKAPDLVLAGINAGENVADDVTYSGTIAGAIEGTLLGIPSIALSQAFDRDLRGARETVRWETAEHHAPGVIRALLDFGFGEGQFFSVNFPDVPPEAAGKPVVTVQGRLTHGLFVQERADGRGRPYYWLGYTRRRLDKSVGTDLTAVDNGQISITPLRLDMTDHGTAERLRARLR